jgi:hypothetical protein
MPHLTEELQTHHARSARDADGPYEMPLCQCCEGEPQIDSEVERDIRCMSCEGILCEGCSRRCDDCGETVCTACSMDEGGVQLCHPCIEKDAQQVLDDWLRAS